MNARKVSSLFQKKINWYIEIFLVLLYKEWVVKYKRTILGFIWSLLYPLLLAGVFYIAFKSAFKIPIKNYSLFLLPGVFVWQWFSNTLYTGVWSFIETAALIKKLPIPKWIIPLTKTTLDLIHFLLAVPILIFFFLFQGYPIYLFNFTVGFLALLLLQLLFNFSLALIFGLLNVFFRDIERLVNILLNFLIFITPIFYSLKNVEEPLVNIILLNPLTYFVIAWRHLFLGELSFKEVIIISIITITFLGIANFIYKLFANKIPENL